MQRQVVLMVRLGGVEMGERHDLGDDRAGEYVGFVQLVDIGERNLLLRVVGIEDHRPVLRSHVGSLAVQLGGIGRHGEEDAQQLGVRDFAMGRR